VSQPFRAAAGGQIDRTKPLRFTFDGRSYQGFAGDTLAAALLANDVCLVGRSFKYHRPRGILSAGSEEPNALVTIDRGPGRITPNLRATQVELFDGLVARSQNRYPSLRFDIGALAERAAPLLSAGFVYKTFMRPRSFWKRWYEPAIRRAAGLGIAPNGPDADRYLHRYAHCEVLVIGGGPAGLAAALGASATGARVILCDEQPELGGSLQDEPDVTIDGWAAADWVREVLASLAGSVTLLPRTTAFGWYPGGMIGLLERVTDHLAEPARTLPRERLWHVRAERVVLATGAIERPLIFPGNDRPGIMLAGAARTYLHRYGVKVGGRAVIVTDNDSAYRTAVDLHRTGMTVARIVDLRPAPNNQAVAAARRLGISIEAGTTIAGTEGRTRVQSVRLAKAGEIVACDTVLMSGGWSPTVHLPSQARQPLRFDAPSGTYLPTQGAVGACAGVFDLAECLQDGLAAGGGETRSFAVAGMATTVPCGPPLGGIPHRWAFVDFQNDVTTKDLSVATAEGFVAIEHVKRYTTTGMATDQGKTSNLNALATVAALTGQTLETVGLTTFRPPYTPVTFGAFAGTARGSVLAPVRLPPIATTGAVLENVGAWKRARCFPLHGESIETAVLRECLTVRNDVAMLDASTLGKIDVRGPDAAAFLSLIYTGDFTVLAVGRCRYAVLLGEDGFIRDDGVVARLSEHHFHVTTTTTGAAFVLHHMEDCLQTEFSNLLVWLTSVTEQWAVIAVQGPRSAETLTPLLPDFDLNTMPHMSVQSGHIDHVSIRLFRVSFTGESGFEINLPPGDAQHLWDTLLQRDVTPYGTEAMHVLCAEKGHIVVGQETDGTVTPDDVGLAWTIGGGDFVGRRSLSLADLNRSDRRQLVGLLPVSPTTLLQEGAQVIEHGRSIGHVTCAYHSAALGRGFALALVAGGRGRIGSTLMVSTSDGDVAVTLADPVFVDKDGKRQRAGPVSPRGPAEPLSPASTTPAPSLTARPSGEVGMALLAAQTRLCVRAGSAAATAIGLSLGVLLPTVPCRSVIYRERAALWLGPDEWLIMAPDSTRGLAAQATKAAGGHPASIVDVSDASHALEITGSRATSCLNAFCALDLDLHAFPVGMCTRTLLGKAQVLLWRLSADVFHVDVARSLLPYTWACLEEARLEFTDFPVAPAV
jgi:sarcosine oxidase subunit alpha